MFIIDEKLKNILYPSEDTSVETLEEDSPAPAASSSTPTSGCEEDISLSSEEMKNIALIMDVKLPVRVRIGRKKMLLKDVLNMDIGSVIELNQLANDPLDI